MEDRRSIVGDAWVRRRRRHRHVCKALRQFDRSLDAVHTWKLWVLRRFPSTVEGMARTTRSTGASGFRFRLVLPIPTVMLLFLLIALLSIAMIDTAVGVVARVGRR